MKIAVVQLSIDDLKGYQNSSSLLLIMKKFIITAKDNGAEIIIFPGFIGVLYWMLGSSFTNFQSIVSQIDHQEYLATILELSSLYEIWICPGSYWKREGTQVYHTSCLIADGKVLYEQKQLYLARWERELNLCRGASQSLIEKRGLKIGILLTTDLFYPQVARSMALMGADILLAPVGYVGVQNSCLQMSGLWKDVQQNQVFGVESAINGFLGDKEFWGESIICAPVEMTPHQDGYLARSYGVNHLLFAELDISMRKSIISQNEILAQLNPTFYNRMNLFGGKS